MNNLPHVCNFTEVCNYIRRYSPDYIQRTMHSADMALQGKLILSGTRGQWLVVGNPPEWHDNKVNNNGYIWMLNRMNHWLILTYAYLFSNQRKYIDRVLLELLDWIESCPAPALTVDVKEAQRVYGSVDPWRQLEVGERVGNVWPFVIRVMDQIPGMLDSARPTILKSILDHGRILREVCPKFWPNADHNYYLTEMWGLYSIALNFPALEESAEWGAFAQQELERCMSSQFSKQGGQLEGCPSYHNFTTIYMGKVALLARKNGISLSEAFVERFRQAMNYCIQTCRPTGQVVPWGDSDADYKAAVTLSLGALFLGENNLVRLLQSLMGEQKFVNAIIPLLFDYPELLSLTGLLNSLNVPAAEELDEPPRVFWDKELDQVSIRSDWSRQAFSVFFVCRTPVYNGHAHIDPSSFDFTAWGQPLVVDPGRYNYWWLEERRKFKSAAWHNTLTINGKDPFEYLSSWEYGPQKQGKIEYVVDSGDWIRASAVHHNYEPIIHRRDLVMFTGQFLLVLDEVSGLTEQDTVQLNWHLDAVQSHWNEDRQIAYTQSNEVNVAVWTAGRKVYGERKEASISDKMDHLRPSTRVIMSDYGGMAGVRRYATVLFPFRGKFQQDQLRSLEVYEKNGQAFCQMKLDHSSYEVVFKYYGKQEGEA
ncbi:alginate lyase family protein [Paenibacillus shunpengii]|uniref:Alginate lyase family protein n=1 Tax=Paenibacillus shunpengii TaxID=2054424 RepID=A0ABW5SQW0_9BACL